MDLDEAQVVLDKVAAQLSEHFDAVQIMVTWLGPDGGTLMESRGRGNWFARMGMAQEMVTNSASQNSALHLKEVVRPDED
jgi:hypothetical protein